MLTGRKLLIHVTLCIMGTLANPDEMQPGLQIRGEKGISALMFWNSALHIKLKVENTLCSLRFQCGYSIYVVKSFILRKQKTNLYTPVV